MSVAAPTAPTMPVAPTVPAIEQVGNAVPNLPDFSQTGRESVEGARERAEEARSQGEAQAKEAKENGEKLRLKPTEKKTTETTGKDENPQNTAKTDTPTKTDTQTKTASKEQVPLYTEGTTKGQETQTIESTHNNLLAAGRHEQGLPSYFLPLLIVLAIAGVYLAKKYLFTGEKTGKDTENKITKALKAIEEKNTNEIPRIQIDMREEAEGEKPTPKKNFEIRI